VIWEDYSDVVQWERKSTRDVTGPDHHIGPTQGEIGQVIWKDYSDVPI
jgi:hypothetical protein